MAGRGPAPKENAARRNAGPTPLRVLTAVPMEQPELPPTFPMLVKVGFDTHLEQTEWPEQTRRWWQMWGDSPLSSDFTSTDWSELTDTAVIHARHWSGSPTAAAELRLRVAKFGATPEDRARLRIQFAQADEADKKAAAPKGGVSRARRGPLTSAG